MVDNILAGVFVLLGIVMAYMLFAVIPVTLYADAKCLAAGYPASHVTVGLSMYCSTLDGAVTVKVDKVK